MNKKWNIDGVYELFKKHNCELLESTYTNTQTKMKYRCDCGNISYISLSNFQKGRRCNVCGYKKRAEKRKHSYEFVKTYIENSGYQLLSTEYINEKTKLLIKCNKNHIYEQSFNSIKAGHGCDICAHIKNAEDRKYTYQEVYDYFLSQGCLLLDAEYYGANHKLHYICNCGSEGFTQFNNFKCRGDRCFQCNIGSRSRENHYLWNPNLTEEERENGRKIEGYDEWRTLVYQRDNYICQICNKKGNRDLVAHHLNGYHWYVEGRIDVKNGVTLCEKDHKEFHNLYGNKLNTKEQFEEFKFNKQKELGEAS